MSLRDGVTGNMSGFELEDEGSTPSPAAISFKVATGISIDSTNKKQAVDFEVMFIRFVGAETDERSHVSAGLFCAASQSQVMPIKVTRAQGNEQCNYRVLICFIRRGWARGTASVIRGFN